MTPAARIPTRSRFGWVQTVVLTLGIALLGLTFLPPAAQAEQSGTSDVSGNGAFMALLCEAGGGKATVNTTRSSGGGLISVVVMCTGGTYDGLHCYFDGNTTMCSGVWPNPVSHADGSQIWQPGEVLPILESGSPEQINQILEDVAGANEQAPVAGSGTIGPDDQQDQDDHRKHKKHKKGKKGGKGRKK